MEYLKEEERGLGLATLSGLSDLWEPHVTVAKVNQLKGMMIMMQLIKALPSDARETIETEAKKNAIKE